MHWTILSRLALSCFLVSLSYYLVTVSYRSRWQPTSYGLNTVAHDTQFHQDRIPATRIEHVSPSTGVHHQVTKYQHEITSWRSPDDEIEHYIIERPKTISKSTSALFLTITNDGKSWGRNPTEPRRTVYDHLNLVTNTTLAPEQTSLGLLTSSRAEYERYIHILTPPQVDDDADTAYFDYPFARVVLILHTAGTRARTLAKGSEVADDSRDERHNIPQHERRALLAKLRNYLTSVSLSHETHVVWLDSDVYRFSSDTMIEHMIHHTSTAQDYEVGILTARCRVGEGQKADKWLHEHPEYQRPQRPKDSDPPEERLRKEELLGKEGGRYEIIAHKTHNSGHYDLNAWAGRRKGPNNEELEALWKDINAWAPSPMEKGQTRILDEVIEHTTDEDVRRLDSVGGTIVMMDAELIRMGLIWPTGYVVGMTYEHGEGYDGIESEGLCLLTRSFSKDGTSMCFTLGGEWSVWHTVF